MNKQGTTNFYQPVEKIKQAKQLPLQARCNVSNC